MPLTAERELVASAFAEVFAAPSAMTVDEWADSHRIVVGSDEPGPWRTRRTPHIRGPMRAWTDDGVDTIVIRFAAQQCKTECIFNCLMFDADTDPKWWMFVYPGFEDCKRVNKKRLIPSLRATPRMAEKFAGERDDATTTEISLGQTEVFFAWTGSDARLKSLPIQRLAEDEIDEFAPGAEALVADRIKASSRPKRIRTSTPSFKGVGIDAAYENSDRRRFERPCPHCRTYREWLWSDVAWGVTDADGTIRTGSQCTPDEAEASAHVVCPAPTCQGKIFDHHRDGMNVRGVWVREGERVEVRDQRSEIRDDPASADLRPLTSDLWSQDPALTGMHLGCPIPGNVRIVGEPVNPSRTAGFRANSLISPFAGSSAGKMVRAFADAGFKMTMEFCRGWLGEAWELKGEKIDDSWLAERCVPVARGGYRFGTVPSWASVLIGGIDVQPHAVHAVVRAFGPRAERSALVWFGTIPAPEAGALAEIDALPARAFEREGGGVARVLLWAIDSGHRAKQVYGFARRHNSAFDRVVVVKGQAETVRSDPYWRSPPDAATGRAVELMHVNVGFFKDEVFAQMQMADAWLLPAGCPEAYLGQVTAEQRAPVVQTVAPSGQRGGRFEKPGSRDRWVLRPGRKDNHAWDVEVYIAAVAFRWHLHTRADNFLGTGASPAPMPPRAAPTPAPPDRPNQQPTPRPAPMRRPGGWMRRGFR